MIELLRAAFSPVNIAYTVLLLLVLVYWFTVIIGFLDFHFFDFDVETDVDVGADAHVATHIEPGEGINPVLSFLVFFNLGKVPFMIFFSFMVLFLWIGSMIGNRYFSDGSEYFALTLLIPNFMVSLLLTKLFTAPLKSVFREDEAEFNSNKEVIGHVGTAKLPIDDSSIGQLMVPTKTGAPLILNAKAMQGNRIERGEKGVVVHYDEENKVFIVEAFED
ncbi:MAG: DUF1449 family protein [Microscillaceae bacterium]|nr:DUF1449 family protein [Microscillaceae bacterium]